MPHLQQYGLVRVRRIRERPEHYDGWRINRRAPVVGDVGTLLDIMSAPGHPDSYVVEACEKDGSTIWLGDFSAEELEPVSQEEPNQSPEPTAPSGRGSS